MTDHVARLNRRTLRALAHPLRIQLLELLRADGPATASGLGERLGESSGTTSWHLRQLAEYGFVAEDTDRGNRRERWWRSVHDGHRMDAEDFLDDPDSAGALNSYLHASVQLRYAAESQFIAELDHWRESWERTVLFDDARLSLTPEETRALSEDVLRVVDRYRREPRAGDETVVAHWAAFPRRHDGERS
ncbi:transcriptional regulator [Amycolatopsis antarctica]|uniref:Transcriptional regulator n=1 Tax=Amycolatopsis antarctica TaxID=1854586 RepID=A0A263D418_9PSEU|nr:helix-turn-helix domain-containing protein [Amycolatopsis antarctica]OZM73111.1 transcriptional regulator [Amycolatopsis antarctica]